MIKHGRDQQSQAFRDGGKRGKERRQEIKKASLLWESVKQNNVPVQLSHF